VHVRRYRPRPRPGQEHLSGTSAFSSAIVGGRGQPIHLDKPPKPLARRSPTVFKAQPTGGRAGPDMTGPFATPPFHMHGRACDRAERGLAVLCCVVSCCVGWVRVVKSCQACGSGPATDCIVVRLVRI
jgi:hypothetical protein